MQNRPDANEQILFSINYRRAFSLERPTPVFNSNAVLDKSEPVYTRTGIFRFAYSFP